MKDTILFFYPDANAGNIIPPYAFLYLERAIRDMNLKSVIIDEHFDQDWKNAVNFHLPRTLAACTSVMLGEQIRKAINFSRHIKECGDVPVIWGGWFPTWKPELCLQEDYVDFIIKGQGEIPFSELIRVLSDQQLSHDDALLSQISGLGFKRDGNIFINRIIKFSSFDQYPPVNYDLLEIEKYVDVTKRGGKIFRYLSSAGCPNKCNFCFIPLGWKGKWFPKSAEAVIEELQYVFDKLPEIDFLSFEDLDFFVDKPRVLKICRALVNNNIRIPWSATTHVRNFLNNYSDDDLAQIKAAGCYSITAGAESGQQDILDTVNKQLSIKEIFDFVRMTDRQAVNTSWSFMVLFPGKPVEDLDITIKMIMKMMYSAKKSKILYVASSYWPAIKNHYYQMALQKGFKEPSDLDSCIRITEEGAAIPWHKPSHLNKLKYFGMFYFRFYYYDKRFRNLKGVRKLGEHLLFIFFRPFIILRFSLQITMFPIEGWLYVSLFKKYLDHEGFFSPKSNRSVLTQIQNYS